MIVYTFKADEEEKDEPPKSTWKPPPTIPKEDNKTGTNKKSFFVCNDGTCMYVHSAHTRGSAFLLENEMRYLVLYK